MNKDKYNYILPSCVNDRENPKSVKSKLKQSYLFWKNELNAPENVLSVISKGYCLPIIDTPNQRVFENNKSATENCEFVTNSIKELLNDGSVKEMPYAPHIVSPLSVSKNSSGKTRLILDLRYLNNHLYKDRIKFNDWRVFKDLISENGFMFKFDLKKGYHHIDIFEKHQQFLGFSWSENLIKKYYVFTVLPFGLSTAPSIFTRMLRPLTSYWHNQGIKICLYIDDGAATDKSFKKAMLHSNIVKSTLEQAGFVINVEKSTWVPQRNIIWLGIEVDFVKNCFYISKQRIDSIKQLCEKITTKKFTTTRDLSKLTGSIVSTKFVLKDIINLKTRNLYNLIENRISWDAKIEISKEKFALDEVLFWQNNIDRLNIRAINANYKISYKIFSDASDTGLGVVSNLGINCQRNLNPHERSESSTWRELQAIIFGLESFESILKNKRVVWNVDNYAATIIVCKGSNKPKLQILAIKIFEHCCKLNIDLKVQWVPREKNRDADLLSKFIDSDDWKITDDYFYYLNKRWGPFSVDRFADSENRKTERFNSRFYCKNTEAVDAFTQSWADENNFIVPPVHRIIDVLKHIFLEGITGTLIIPLWKSSPFWSLVARKKFQSTIIEKHIVERGSTVLQQGSCPFSILGSTNYKGSIVAFKFSTVNIQDHLSKSS